MITRAEAKKGYDGSLFDSVLKPVLLEEAGMENGTGVSAAFSCESAAEPVRSASPEMPSPDGKYLPVTRERLCVAQKADPTLRRCFNNVVSADKAREQKVCYLLDKDVLVRRWSPPLAVDVEWSVTHQVVVASVYRQHVLSVAHESQWSGRLGVTKTD